MAKLTFDQVNPGDSLPSLHRYVTQDIIDRNAVASLDYNPVHINAEWCRAARTLFPNYFTDSPVGHGMMTMSFMASAITDWAYPGGKITLIDCKFIRPVYPGDTITCKGKVVKKYVESDEHRIECEIWVENSKGERTTPGTAVVVLPRRRM